MIRDQCRAYCQCNSCKDGSNNDENNSKIAAVAAKSLDKYNDLASTSVDAAYLALLHESLKHTAKAASMRNASKFTPDEQLLSSTRNDKDVNAMMSDMVPLRRRDRLQELLILEEKKRLREKAKLRELRRAAGLPSSDDDDDDEGDSDKNEKSQKTNNNDNKESSDAEKTTTTGTPNANQNDTSNSANYIASTNGFTNTESAPCHVCSAEDDLQSTLIRIRKVMEMDKSNEKSNFNHGSSNTNNTIDHMYSEILQGSTEPLSRQQIYELRKIIHDHSVKAQDTARVENAETNQPRLCNHCFEVNVQAKHLCPDVVNGSVAFDETGKVINPHEGVKYGTSAKRGMDGTYRHDTERAFLNSTKNVSKPTRTNFNMQSKDKLSQSEILRGVTINKGNMPPQNTGSALYKSNNNNNNINNVNGNNRGNNFMPSTKVNDNTYSEMKTTNSVQNGIDYPGSTYNAYLSNNTINNDGNKFTGAGVTQSENDKYVHTNDIYNVNKYMSSTSNDNACKITDGHTFSGASVDRPVKECKTSASL